MRCAMPVQYYPYLLDLIDSIFKNKITLFILLCGKELLRCKKIYAAVDKDGILRSREFKIVFFRMMRRLLIRILKNLIPKGIGKL